MYWNPFGLPPTRSTTIKPWKALLLAALLALVLAGRPTSKETAANDVHNALHGVKKEAPQPEIEADVSAGYFIDDLGLRVQLIVSTPENRVWRSAALRSLALLWGEDTMAPNARSVQTDVEGHRDVNRRPNRYEQERRNAGVDGGKRGVEKGTTEFILWLPIIPGERPG